MTSAQRLPLATTVAFGMVVVCAFGSWFYGYGVLVEPIIADTGWAEAPLSTAYGLGLFGVGIGAVLAGRVIDSYGPRAVFIACAAGVGVGTAVATTATSPLVFVPAAIGTQCFVGAAGYYTAVHASISRLVPRDRARAITVNTLWGAFASPVFMPLMAWLALSVGWRAAMGVSGVLVLTSFLAAAWFVPQRAEPTGAPPASLREGLVHAVANPTTRRLLIAGLCGGVAGSVLFLYQVPAMVSAGLSLGLASTLAGLRGLFQLLGRLPLPWLIGKIGPRPIFRTGLALVGLSAVLLLFSGNIVLAAAFVVIAGIAVGAHATLESIYTAEVVNPSMIGMLLGAYSLVRGIGSALGPTGAGLLTEVTGDRVAALVTVALIAMLGALIIPKNPNTHLTTGRA